MPGVAESTTVWRHDRGALSRQTPRSVIVLPAGTDAPLLLEGAAAVVWTSLSEPADDEQLVQRVAARVGSMLDAMRAEVVATRLELSDAGAIVETG
jgi:hypothetical protein